MGAALAYVIVIDGRIAGTWQRSVEKKAVRVELAPFRKLTPREEDACRTAATRFVRFLGADGALELRILE
jgi:hypothetical protein